ncbi:hypothetical protein EVB32_121 [Rhizobium phage RHph_TM39]|uniref:Uncharacterized protein n=2 Tax=Cuauhnahuacvirus TaxID=3044696 RepID=A0A7S5UXN6_9CAUD|nr:hypothetical protein PQC16_gp121 [Rhizobium phage RHph_TM30]YP_010671272.1 hypothetical protein PQC17_gp123 [Rhizobium phage RHph_Y65]QIG71592.1 hypothetical protein EVB94_121 [Rhizobium phage RHph_TM40]QIG71955.1 hypothetical protein EVB95_121 [Rhizobium phage RHph_TM2_3B]QIG72317.1 hypothetical protein EVB96_121 [Rhizobium phage RHph_TM3_3_6]QIG77109.1 hypothetical protein EVB32_121 [Rhizobium phage RHph_TM39]QIG71228.1 hypothetical protein EVB93_121 [Rhizobium phage RHph_TM30]
MANRINRGIYKFTYKNIKFELERYPDRSWHLFYEDESCPREWINDYSTKRLAITRAKEMADNGSLS